jgi:hypothetical protein
MWGFFFFPCIWFCCLTKGAVAHCEQKLLSIAGVRK